MELDGRIRGRGREGGGIGEWEREGRKEKRDLRRKDGGLSS